MGWSSAFVAGLESRTIAFCYVLEVVQIYNEPGNVWSVGSHPGLGMVTGLGLRGISVQGSTLSARTWSSTIGAFTVELVGDIQELCKNITRGTVVTLRAGFEGMAVYDFERIALGQVRNLRGTAPSWTLECVDLLTLCRVRLQRTFGNPLLFDSIGNTTTLGANYTAGDGTVPVASTGVRTDQQPVRSGVQRDTHRTPPSPDTLDCEAGRVLIRTDVHPSEILTHVVDTIRYRLVHI